MVDWFFKFFSVRGFREPRPLVAAAFRLPHDGPAGGGASTSTRQRGSLKAYFSVPVLLLFKYLYTTFYVKNII